MGLRPDIHGRAQAADQHLREVRGHLEDGCGHLGLGRQPGLLDRDGIAWVSTKGALRGYADVYIDGVLKATVNLLSSTYQAQRIVFAYNWSTNGTHTIKVVCVGTAGHSKVDLDGFSRIVLS